MVICHDKERVDLALKQLGNQIRLKWDGDKPIEISYRKQMPAITRSQQNLMWRWYTEIGKVVGKTKDEMHDLLRYKFFGTETVTILDEEITRLPSTTGKSRGEIAQYMLNIEVWATDLGIMLPMPEDNEYMKYREAAQ